jgi:hypothetical protein
MLINMQKNKKYTKKQKKDLAQTTPRVVWGRFSPGVIWARFCSHGRRGRGGFPMWVVAEGGGGGWWRRGGIQTNHFGKVGELLYLRI